MRPTLLLLAAGLSRRYGKPKPLVGLGPSGETLIDYAIFDSTRAGFGDVVIVTRPTLRDALEKHIIKRWPSKTVHFVFQELVDLPEGFALPPGRTKPWGTGHAVLAARHEITNPFVVINCDDFYGDEAYRLASRHLQTDFESHALVAFRLDETLSSQGGVSRGICSVTHNGFLHELVEMLQLRKVTTGVEGTTRDGLTRTLTGSEPASMNFWVFYPEIFDQLMMLFTRFVASQPNTETEFFLSDAVGRLVKEKMTTVRVFETRERWFGLTHPEDLPIARDALRTLMSGGRYPANIASDHTTS